MAGRLALLAPRLALPVGLACILLPVETVLIVAVGSFPELLLAPALLATLGATQWQEVVNAHRALQESLHHLLP